MAGKDPRYVSKLVLKNNGVMETEDGTEIVSVDSSGTPSIKANIEDSLAQGSIYIGDATGTTSELDASGNAEFLIGNGTTATMATIAGDISIDNAGTGTVNWLGQTVQAANNVGTPNTGVNAMEYGDSYNHVTVLDFTNLTVPGPAGAANEALGYLLYTFPAGVHVHTVTAYGIALQGGGVVDADTPDVGIGSVIGTGAVAALGGTTAFEDYITGQAFTDCNGTTENVGPVGATAGYGTDISLNGAASAKTVHLNYAFNWTGADTLEASGGLVLHWTSLPTGP